MYSFIVAKAQPISLEQKHTPIPVNPILGRRPLTLLNQYAIRENSSSTGTGVTLFISWSQNESITTMSLFPGLPYCLMGCHQGPGTDFQVGAVPQHSSETNSSVCPSNVLWKEQDMSLQSLPQPPSLICPLYSLQLGKMTPQGIPSKSRQLTLLESPGLQPALCRSEAKCLACSLP